MLEFLLYALCPTVLAFLISGITGYVLGKGVALVKSMLGKEPGGLSEHITELALETTLWGGGITIIFGVIFILSIF